MAMIAITTSNSINVKARGLVVVLEELIMMAGSENNVSGISLLESKWTYTRLQPVVRISAGCHALMSVS